MALVRGTSIHLSGRSVRSVLACSLNPSRQSRVGDQRCSGHRHRLYKSQLSTGRWQVTSSAGNQVGWRLMRGKRTDASGTVTARVSDDRTEIDVDAYS